MEILEKVCIACGEATVEYTYIPAYPSVVSRKDVRMVLRASTGKIDAIKHLRDRCPGLCLKDAKDIIEAEMVSLGWNWSS